MHDYDIAYALGVLVLGVVCRLDAACPPVYVASNVI